MSSNVLRLIPSDPHFIPTVAAQMMAKAALEVMLPLAEQVNVKLTADIEFVDQGGNFERILCPTCGSEIQLDWWDKAMEAAYAAHFSRLLVEVPCCHALISLNDLDYEWPAGFARFVLEALNPNAAIEQVDLARISDIIGHEIRVVWAHY